MSDLQIKAWVFVNFGVSLWEAPEMARLLSRWKIIFNRYEAFEEADRRGMQGSAIIDTSDDGKNRMLVVFDLEFEAIKDWDAYVRNYVDTVTDRPKNLLVMSGCACGMLAGNCGCGDGCACGSSESCKCK